MTPDRVKSREGATCDTFIKFVGYSELKATCGGCQPGRVTIIKQRPNLMEIPAPAATEPLVPVDASARDRNAVLLARYGILEGELEAAPFHRVGTFWWEERTKEMSFIKHRLGK